MKKISLCTVSKNRLHHVKETLPQNIRDNVDFPMVEFVLLDYNSDDGLQEWVQKEMKSHLDSGVLQFYRTEDPDYFDRSHSRNMAMRLASGEVLCNVDADNFTGKAFAAFLSQSYEERPDRFFRIDLHQKDVRALYKDALGRVSIPRKVFHELTGYDEAMKGYGHEDQDLYFRLEQYGLNRDYFRNTDFLHSIAHPMEERGDYEEFSNTFSFMMVSYLHANQTDAVFFYQDGSFEQVCLTPNTYDFYAPASVIESSWKKGTWERKGGPYYFTYEDGSIHELIATSTSNIYKNLQNERDYRLVNQKAYLKQFSLLFPIMMNARKHQFNVTNGLLKVNEAGFGKGDVIKNFKQKLEIA